MSKLTIGDAKKLGVKIVAWDEIDSAVCDMSIHLNETDANKANESSVYDDRVITYFHWRDPESAVIDGLVVEDDGAGLWRPSIKFLTETAKAIKINDAAKDQLDEALDKPIAWNGEGLPPVGVHCEWKGNRGGFWVPCFIIANNGVKVVAQNTGEYRTGEFEILDLTYHEFRKPETQEQRAEREREDWIECAMNDIRSLSDCNKYVLRNCLADLYDAGYRKQ